VTSMSEAPRVRVLVVEDSAVTREYLVYLLEQDPALTVAGAAVDGADGVELAVRLRPDVILMDVHMPKLDGFEATRQIMERAPTPVVMVTASFDREETVFAFDALAVGALTILDKPTGPDDPRAAETARLLVDTVKLMAQVKVVRRWPRRDRPPAPAAPVRPGRGIRVVAIGASTGGPVVLKEILPGLPDDFPAPVLVVQHIVPGFVGGLCEWLGKESRLTVKLAAPGEVARAGTVYFPPDGAQMGIARDGRIQLGRGTGDDGFCPSASYLFRSVAEAYDRAAMGILLTGMGRDGAAGLLRMREAGGVTIAQNEETSVVFGMPAEAIRLGAAEHVLPPAQIVAMLQAVAAASRRPLAP
jgi:two-component system chemotaxis response regulator CheB